MNILINRNHGIVPNVGDVGILMQGGNNKAFIPTPQIAVPVPVPKIYHLYTLEYAGNTIKDRGECTLDNTMGTVDDNYITFYFIQNGKLFIAYGTNIFYQIASDKTWKWCSGQVYSNGGLAIDTEGYLYYLNDSTKTVEQIGTQSGWRKCSGTKIGNALAVSDFGLYRIVGTDTSALASQLDSNSDWDLPTVYGEPYGSQYGLATRNNSVYKISGGGDLFLIDDSTKSTPWTDLTGYIYGASYAYGINDGKLYGFTYTGACIQIGTDSGWTKIAGFDWNNSSATGIRDGKLYNVYGTSAYLLDDTMTWTDVSGSTYRTNSSYNVSIAFAIGDGKLYKRKGTTLTQLGTDTGWVKVYGTLNDSAGSAVAIREVEE